MSKKYRDNQAKDIAQENAVNEDEVVSDIESEQKPYVVLKNFEQIIGDVLLRLQKGKIISDFNLIQRLLGARAPIAEVGTDKDYCVCPNCKHIFANENNGRKSA